MWKFCFFVTKVTSTLPIGDGCLALKSAKKSAELSSKADGLKRNMILFQNEANNEENGLGILGFDVRRRDVA